MGLFKSKEEKEQEKKAEELQKEIENLKKNWTALVEDMLDNYAKYSDEDKEALYQKLKEVTEFNKTVLDKYDDEPKKKEKKATLLDKIKSSFLRIFGHE